MFVYDATGKLIAEYSNQVSQNPTISYTATDPFGSPRVITDKQGNVISRRDFMPFGEDLNAGVGNRTEANKYGFGNDNIRKRFTGYEKDTETGLDFAEARYYNDQHGRFTAVDPLIASGKSANPQTFNRYIYALNNPLKFKDSNGLQVGCVLAANECRVEIEGGRKIIDTQSGYDRRTHSFEEKLIYDTDGAYNWRADPALQAINDQTNSLDWGIGMGIRNGVASFLNSPWEMDLTAASRTPGTPGTFSLGSGISLNDLGFRSPFPYETPRNFSQGVAEFGSRSFVQAFFMTATGFLGAKSAASNPSTVNLVASEDLFPAIKQGSSGGETAFTRYVNASTKREAVLENPNLVCVFCRQQNSQTSVRSCASLLKRWKFHY